MKRTFLGRPVSADLALDLLDDPFPSRLRGWSDGPSALADDGTHFGFVYRGPTRVRTKVGSWELATGMYFALPHAATIEGGSGIVITRLGFRGFLHLGGPIEPRGRLRYIDGCTDSLLIAPIMLGDPCLNLLHLPAGTRQTAHTHPSHRIGLIIAGTGHCVTPETAVPLAPGLAFVIAADARHSFHTAADELLVLAYHPDSDFGPTHECHPMVNRTILPAVDRA